MNAEYNQAELFDRYLERRLTLKETKEFEARLKIEPDFSESFRLHKEIDFALLEEEILFFRQELDKIHQESTDEELWKAPMMINPTDQSQLDEAIMEEDVVSLRGQLDQIHTEIDFDIFNEEIPKYTEIEKAVAEQDSVRLNSELDRFDANSEYAYAPVLAELDLLDIEIDQAIMESDVMKLRSEIRAVGDEIAPLVKVIPLQTKINRVIAAAAIVIILISSGLFVGQRSGADNWMDRNLDKLGVESTGPGASRGVDDETDEKIRHAYAKFLEQDYQEALTVYGFVENEYNDGPHTWIYQGIANYELREIEKASNYFLKVLEDDDN